MKDMKLLRMMLLGSLLASAPGCLLGVEGSYSASASYEVEAEPPPPRRVVVVQRPGHVWIDGYWRWGGSQGWAWTDGSYQPERQGDEYIQGRWVGQGRRWHWNPGGWRSAQAHERNDQRRDDRNEKQDQRGEHRHNN